MVGDRPRPVSDDLDEDERCLRVRIEVDLPEESACPLAEMGDIHDIRAQAVGDVCRVEGTVYDRAVPTVRHAVSEVTESCFCAVFARHDCIPVYERVDGRTVIVSTYAPDRDVLRELIADLGTMSQSVAVTSLRCGASDAGGETTVIDLSSLTDTQRETATVAVAAGYFDSPRGVSFADLAEELGVSESALSQRLRTIESKLITATFGGETES